MINKKSFTLMELVIVVAILAILGLVSIMLINPKKQIDNALDKKRVSEFDLFRNILEDYYNDKGCYPKSEDLCYPGVDNGDPVNKNPCYMCGTFPTSPDFSPYVNQLPCDPNFPARKYLYYSEANTDCPQWYKLYAKFSSEGGQQSVDIGCGIGGCGAPPNYGYDYAVTSPNVAIDVSKYFYCLTTSYTCDNCLTYENCQINTNCVQIYGTFPICCQENSPKPNGCP